MKSLLILTLGALLACPFLARADSATNDAPPGPPPGGPGGHHMKFLTEAEKAELKKAHEAALAADPSLAKEDADLKAAHEAGTPPTEEEKADMKAFHEKMDAAMVKADPAVAPILAKIKAHHHGPGGPGGPPPPPDSGTGSIPGSLAPHAGKQFPACFFGSRRTLGCGQSTSFIDTFASCSRGRIPREPGQQVARASRNEPPFACRSSRRS